MRIEVPHRWFHLLPLVVLSLLFSACIHLAPLPYAKQREEARALGKILRSLTPEARAEVAKEHRMAQELRITLDELAKLAKPDFISRFDAFSEQLRAIRKQRGELVQALDSRQWSSPMVQAVQQAAVEHLQQDRERIEKWIELEEGVRMRVELGREENFPELTMLDHQLDIFLAAKSEMDPFANRLRALQEAFSLSETDFP